MDNKNIIIFSKQNIESFLSCFSEDNKICSLIKKFTDYFHYYLKGSSNNRQLYYMYRNVLAGIFNESNSIDKFLYALGDLKHHYLIALKNSLISYFIAGLIFLLVKIYVGKRNDANSIKAQHIAKNYGYISYGNMKACICIMQDFKEIMIYHDVDYEENIIKTYKTYSEIPRKKIEFNQIITHMFDTMLHKIIVKMKIKCSYIIKNIFEQCISTNLTDDEWEELIEDSSICAFYIYQITDDNNKLQQSLNLVNIDSMKEHSSDFNKSTNKGIDFINKYFVFT
jgi:hypothetical protein